MASVFFAAGYVENWGQGIGKVLEECKKNGNPSPVFSIRNGGLSVELGINPSKDITDTPQHVLDTDEKNNSILTCIKGDSGISARAISEITGMSINTVERRLKKMVEAGVLRREGSSKSGKWVIIRSE